MSEPRRVPLKSGCDEKRKSQEAFSRVPGMASYFGRYTYTLFISLTLQPDRGTHHPVSSVSSWEVLSTSLPPRFIVAGQARGLGALGLQRRLGYLPGCEDGLPLRTVSETLMRSLFNRGCELCRQVGESRNTLHNN